VVQEPVEDRGSDGLVAEDAAPFGDLLIGREQDAPALVALGHELKEQIRRGALKRQVASSSMMRSLGLAKKVS